MVDPRDAAGNAEEEVEEEKRSRTQKPHPKQWIQEI